MIMFICFFIINIMDNSLWDTLHEDLQKKIIKIRDDELEYDTKLLKLSNDFVRQYISDYMRSKGRRITNLNTANKTNLLSLFKKFKIPKIPYDIVVKDKEKIKKIEINSKSKFEIGRYKCRYENDFDGSTTIYILTFNITKVSKCYITADITNQYGREYSNKKTNRFWINKSDDYEYIDFSVFLIRSNELIPE